MILRDGTSPQSVFANTSGTIPVYASLSALNQTFIGTKCSKEINDACTSWETLLQTGWFFDSVNDLLYIHYAGARDAEIVITP